jgi:hypothetical protein
LVNFGSDNNGRNGEFPAEAQLEVALHRGDCQRFGVRRERRRLLGDGLPLTVGDGPTLA